MLKAKKDALLEAYSKIKPVEEVPVPEEQETDVVTSTATGKSF